MMILLCVILLLPLLYICSLRGRRAGKPLFSGWAFAHRGLHGDSVPENSMAAFREALDAGYGIELDIHLMKDGKLAVIHDASLKRTAGVEVNIEDLTAEELHCYPLEGTSQTIPLFSQVLELYEGKAPMIIELKPDRKNYAALTEAACAAMEGYRGSWCMESFDPRCIFWLRRHRPDIIRGQLAYNYFSKPSPLPGVLKFLLTRNLLNFLTRPDFIAYQYADRNIPEVKLCRKLWGIQGVSWTLQTREEYDRAVDEGWIPIFENFKP